jgi:predicted aldo/keto reductase-like oxidoreductase
MTYDTSRRSFLSASLALPLVGLGRKIGPFQSGNTPAGTTSPVKLDYRTLGKTGLKVTTLGFGCMITSDPSVITRAADLGINYFDTARVYQHGNNEKMVGAALKGKRKQIILCTKSPAGDKAGALKDLDTSLKELGTDYVDIWYLHAKEKPSDVRDELIAAQQIAKQQGKIRFAGVSTHSGQKELLPWMVQKGAFDVVLVAYNFTMDSGMEQAVEAAAKGNLGVVGMKVMAGGFKSLKPGDPTIERLHREGAMLSALKWTLKNPNVATTIPSMTDMDQLEENLKAMAQPFGSPDEKLLATKLEIIKPLYCRLCGECEGTCSKGLAIQDTLRFLTYAEGYGQFALGREHFQKLPVVQQTARCEDCEGCTVNCRHGVQVAARMSRAQELFA